MYAHVVVSTRVSLMILATDLVSNKMFRFRIGGLAHLTLVIPRHRGLFMGVEKDSDERRGHSEMRGEDETREHPAPPPFIRPTAG